MVPPVKYRATGKRVTVSRPKALGQAHPSAYARLYALGVERVRIVDSMLIEGDSADAVADMIQNEWGEFQDVASGTLSKQLMRYRDNVLSVRLVAATQRAKAKGTTVFEAAREFNNAMDVMGALNTVANMQFSRLLKVYALEKKTKGLKAIVSAEMRPTVEAIKALGMLQLETGVLRRAPKTLSGVMAPLPDSGGAVSFEMQVKTSAELRSAILDAMRIIQDTSLEGELAE